MLRGEASDCARHAKRRQAPDDDVLRVPAELAGFVEQRLEVAQFHAQDQGVFWNIAFSHSPKAAIAFANSAGGSASSADQRLM